MGVVYKMGPCGFSGGGTNDMNMDGITRIIEIRVNSGAAIDSVTILLERKGLKEWTPRWGGDGGGTTEIRLDTNEYLTSVAGYVGKQNGMIVVKSLTFVTNQLRLFGPYGEQQGLPFELPAAGGKILGFHGRSGRLVDAIGTYVVKMP